MGNTILIVVISDTHRSISNAVDIINTLNPDYVLHLGDLEGDCDELKYIFDRTEIIGVSGNCDWGGFSVSPTERMLDIGGVKILMCHGHTYSVKSGYDRLIAAARVKGADIALFGHTHRPVYDHMGDMAILNPGTVDTFGLVEIKDGTFRGCIKTIGELK